MAAEQLRRTLLAQTGITCWFPRWSQPGAAPSHLQCFELSAPYDGYPDPSPDADTAIEVPSESAVDQRGNTVAPQPYQVAPAAAAAPTLASVRAQLLVEPAVPVGGSPVSLVAGANIADIPDSEVRAPVVDLPEPFAFSWFPVDKRMAVLCMLPPGAARLSGSCRQMLARLLGAMTPSWQTLALNEQSFHWPFVDAPDLPADSSSARQAVDAFVARRLREQNAAMVLVLADSIPWFTGATGESAELSHRLSVHPRFGFAMLCTHSLHAMEENAGLKREAWQALQVIRDRLARTAGE